MDKNTSMNMYDMDQVDHINIPAANQSDYQNEHIIQYTQSSGNMLQFNFSNADNPEGARVLANANFRKALGYAIERTALCTNFSDPAYSADGRLVASAAATASGKPWAQEYTDIELYPATMDEEKAKAYLDAALAELGIASAADLPGFTFLIFDVPTYRSYAEGLTDVWSRVLGVNNIEISVLPIPQAIQAGMQGQFDIYLAGISRGSDSYGMYQGMAPGGAYNWTTWEGDEEFGEMLAATNAIIDPKERYDAMFECEKFFAEHGFMIPLWSYGATTAVRPAVGLTGYTVDSFTSPNVQIVFADVIPDSQRN